MLVFPLAQDLDARRAIAFEGEPLDTLAACRPLTPIELARGEEMRAAASARLAPEATKARQQFITRRGDELAERTGMDHGRARQIIARQCDGVLLPNLELPWDDAELAGATVADVLVDPDRFEGATLADPLEGVEYGRCKARVMRRRDGSMWINSFAHGGICYDLKFDFHTASAVIEGAPEDQIGDLFVRLVIFGDLDPVEIDRLITVAQKRGKIGRKALRAKLKSATDGQPRPTSRQTRFTISDGCLAYLKEIEPGRSISIPLANFSARIIEDQVFDDGAAELRRYRIHGEINDGTELPDVTVPADEFAGVSWIGPRWGARPIVHAGLGPSMICEAIQTMSGAVDEKMIFGHLGWRMVDDEWVYLHARGAIGAKGPVDAITVDIDGELSHFVLPKQRNLKAAIRESIKLLDLNTIIAGATWRAPLAEFCPVNFSVFTEGRTGSLKSALHGVAQAHWGERWGNGVHAPANWSATANFLEKTAFIAKDCLLVIDDFVPATARYAAADLHQKAEQVMRAQGNLGGRGRLDRNTATRPTYYPRGLIASSGEDVPRGQSLRARMIIDLIGPDDINPAKLATLQKAATTGLLAEAMAGYVQWLAERADGGRLRDELAQQQIRLCEKFSSEHRRSAQAAASLMLGIKIFIEFAASVGAIGDMEADALEDRALKSLSVSTTTQQIEQRQENPVDMFVDAIPSLLAAGRAHLTNTSGSQPKPCPSLLGWQIIPRRDSLGGLHSDWMPQGDRIGWLSDNQVWLLPNESVAAVERLLRDHGRSLAVGRNALGKRLRETGWLIDCDRESFTKTKKTDVGAVRVFVLSETRLLDNESEPQPNIEEMSQPTYVM